MPYYTNKIMVTGYWPPTNDMLRRFSPDDRLNPAGWIGRNWRNTGFDVHAFFPTFDKPPEQVGHGDAGAGDFRVDYQDTSNDWRRITAALRPCAIVTFSRGWPDNSWELEARVRNLRDWIPDFHPPTGPIPSPPDPSRPAGAVLGSTLPMSEIRRRVNDHPALDIRAYIDNSSDYAGGFLSEFIGYHGCWYQADRASNDTDGLCFAAGHVHVGGAVPLDQARLAAELTIRAVIDDIAPRRPSYWLSQIRCTVATKDSPHAGTDHRVVMDLLRDGDVVARLALDYSHLDDHERGDRRRYRFVLPELEPDPRSGRPPQPAKGIEFGRGMHGRLVCRLHVQGDDKWRKDDVVIEVKETRPIFSGGTTRWVEDREFRTLWRYPQDITISRDATEGVEYWNLLV